MAEVSYPYRPRRPRLVCETIKQFRRWVECLTSFRYRTPRKIQAVGDVLVEWVRVEIDPANVRRLTPDLINAMEAQDLVHAYFGVAQVCTHERSRPSERVAAAKVLSRLFAAATPLVLERRRRPRMSQAVQFFSERAQELDAMATANLNVTVADARRRWNAKVQKNKTRKIYQEQRERRQEK